MTGEFSYLIPCSGTLVAVNATGFCILTERPHHDVSLVIFIYRENAVSVHLVPANCDLANRTSVSGLNYSFGSVSHNDLNIPVTSDEFLLISSCTGITCFFQPAVINDTSKHMLFFLEDGKPVNETENVSLLFSATIEISNGKLFWGV